MRRRKIDMRRWNGGRRERSGRKPLAVRKVQCTIRVDQATAEFLRRQAALTGSTISEVIEWLFTEDSDEEHPENQKGKEEPET
jgi:hypothetical protein